MNDESKLFNVSVRSFITLVLTFTVCYMSLFVIKIDEPLYSAFMLTLGFYFGQKTQEVKNKGKGNEKSS